MLNFIGTLAILKFCEYGGFGPSPALSENEDR